MTAPHEESPGRRRIALFANPHSGDGDSMQISERVAGRLRKHGVGVDEYVGDDPAHARRLMGGVLERGVDAVVVVGGDGMVSHALQEIAGTSVPLGVIPAGTGNDLARYYGILRDDTDAAADVILTGNTSRVDVGVITTADGKRHRFNTVVATGFDSLVTDRTNRLPWPRGRPRYWLALLIELVNLRPLPFRIIADGHDPLDVNVSLVATGNTSSYGGGMRICPEADSTDGLLDITMVEAGSRRRLLRFFPLVFSGEHVRRPEVRTMRTASVRIEADAINAYADGEYLGPLPVDISVVPRDLSLLVPAE